MYCDKHTGLPSEQRCGRLAGHEPPCKQDEVGLRGQLYWDDFHEVMEIMTLVELDSGVAKAEVQDVRKRPDDLIRFKVTDRNVGAEEDPYSEVTYEVWMRGSGSEPSARLLVSGLLTEYMLWIDGREVPRPTHMDGVKWNAFVEWTLEGVTGVRVSDLDVWAAAIAEDSEGVRSVEQAVGWDSSP